jgi:hypothetical protein
MGFLWWLFWTRVAWVDRMWAAGLSDVRVVAEFAFVYRALQ